MKFRKFLTELKRRNVYKAGIAYSIVAWLIVQVASIIIPIFEAPPIVMKVLLFLLIVGFPINLVFSWIYDVTPEGLKKTENLENEFQTTVIKSSRLNKVILSSLTLVAVMFIINLFVVKQMVIIDVGEKSIAVLAFTDMSPKKDQEYFSDGISEELLNLLSKIPEVRVMSRTSSFSYKGKDATSVEIGEKLNVSYILEGSIRKAANKVRISAQLINAIDGSHIWSETFDHVLDSIFDIQDEIALKVIKQLKTELVDGIPKSSIVDVDAYNLYLQAKHLVHQNTKIAYITAEEMIKKSIEIDSTYGMSWSLLADIYHTSIYNFSIYEYEIGTPLGIKASKKAIELDPTSAKGYATLSSFQELNWNFDQSAENLKKALELEPNNAVIVSTAANMTFGDINKSIELLHRSMELDPLLYLNYYNLGFSYYKVNELEKAEEAFRKFAVYYPNSQILHYMQGMVGLAQGNNDYALKEIEMETHEFFSLYGRNFIYYALGRQEEADNLLKEFIQKYSKTDPANLADLYAFRGEIDQSFFWLNKALDIKDPVLLEALAYPSFKILHKDPRWNSFINKIELPSDHGYALN